MLTLANHFFRQSFFLGKPELTENNLPSQEGRNVIITGGYAGVGLELAKILYRRHATIYIAGRSAEKAERGIEAIKKSSPDSKGKLEFMKLDLADLTTIKPAVEAFLQKESELHVLVNNAGVMFPPPGSKTIQGHDMQLGTNCLGHFLLSKLLTPVLEKTAASCPKDSVRISWAGSLAVDLLSPKGGLTFDSQGNPEASATNTQLNYGMSKVGNYYYGKEYARRHPILTGGKGVVNTSFNPGNLSTELQRHVPGIQAWVLDKLFLYPAVFGAYTELWASFQPDVPNGSYVWPWGMVGNVKPDVEAELKEGGNAEKFWEWSERETKQYS